MESRLTLETRLRHIQRSHFQLVDIETTRIGAELQTLKILIALNIQQNNYATSKVNRSEAHEYARNSWGDDDFSKTFFSPYDEPDNGQYSIFP